MLPGAEDEILKPDRLIMMQQEQQALHRSVSEGHLLKTQISIKEEVTVINIVNVIVRFHQNI